MIELRLSEIDCLHAVVWGAEDAWLPLAQGEQLAALMVAPLTMVPDTGHLVQEDTPEVVLATAFGMLGKG